MSMWRNVITCCAGDRKDENGKEYKFPFTATDADKNQEKTFMNPFGGGPEVRKSPTHFKDSIESSRTCVQRIEALKVEYNVDMTESGWLGEGHFAKVYKGFRIRDGLSVAVKIISREVQKPLALRAEIEALLKVRGHPNIVSLYDVYVGKRKVVLTMELCYGGQLFERIVRTGAYSEQDASHHFKKLTNALVHMHKHSIVHRDLKPENLILADTSPDSEIKIGDFGLSKVLDEKNSIMLTICGTNAYAAPEIQLNRNTGYDALVDTWSLGIILFIILSAYHPFDPHCTNKDQQFRERICTFDWSFEDKKEIWSQISAEAKDLIKQLICPVQLRLSAVEILQHDWLQNVDSLPQLPLKQISDRSLIEYVMAYDQDQDQDVQMEVNMDTENLEINSNDGWIHQNIQTANDSNANMIDTSIMENHDRGLDIDRA
uniref:Protein kinase domain-containing protein n=1 Tax=Aplanochytrium stocchinoi TaxID=215587 RepID=A0A7S3V2G6_9STRA|mmetsp:Transcript_14112/g.18296  ORF Transcript_14112/g.18296 Transcript_14112/m.18296 type:complete len:431 (-) Transcript_14112:610-1902(-)|eukprot:CAMPEP_0204830356 /NCGR_PEP_ID=MMETSP1346-20131115/8486_1 /ASSEMBLY_ACC=CAM_ASM_000771 /TAXON_ID=215587 /ORGANISM="Aplanochytrium stocchinoi, Strain GSBS06" /LENGTH=430 /DNA_ID=CAMNT_0051960541 /DNA_START=163 /DNA_END=1455 /DNA_ORIENTATION=+